MSCITNCDVIFMYLHHVIFVHFRCDELNLLIHVPIFCFSVLRFLIQEFVTSLYFIFRMFILHLIDILSSLECQEPFSKAGENVADVNLLLKSVYLVWEFDFLNSPYLLLIYYTL